jgi:hypothetical protein
MKKADREGSKPGENAFFNMFRRYGIASPETYFIPTPDGLRSPGEHFEANGSVAKSVSMIGYGGI